MKKTLTNHKLAFALGGAVFGIAAIAGGITTAMASDDRPLTSEKYSIEVGTTKDGRTYGSMFDAEEGGPTYDLVSVIGINGKQGYVDRKDYENLKASVFASGSPGDTSAAKETATKLAAGDLSLPVYAPDGVTEVDKYVLGKAKGFQEVTGVDPDEFQKRPAP